MRPAEPFLARFQSPGPEAPELSHPVESRGSESLPARIAAAGVLCAAVATIVWYVFESVLGL